MLFNTPLFLWFFAGFFLLYSFVFLRRTPRIWLILVASLVFYAGWNYRFIPLLVLSSVVDYGVALGLERAEGRERTRRWLLALSIATNLGILGVFKYSPFMLDSVSGFLTALGYPVTLPTLEILLPVGISFYTFQSMSYTIDVYRGVLRARRGLLEFTAALAFFPQLVAGPILRARQILPQLENLPKPSWNGVKHGLVLITVGLCKKTAADLLAAPVAAAFDGPDPASWLETWTGVLAFAGQIYGDFSGYTDIAIGLALLLGFQIPPNFRLPYFATSPADFWRRWHISLSTWLRDYLYISLGGNRAHRYVNVMITMLLGGLWHGASWTFVAWGAFHGLLVSATRALENVPALTRWAVLDTFWARALKMAGTFYLVLMGWVLFRAQTLDGAWQILVNLHSPQGLPASATVAPVIAGLTVVAVVWMHALDWVVIHKSAAIERRGWLLWPLLVIGHLFTILIGDPGRAFIYFQF
jgi:D-alanyl-lipoteichoic acid acyltransferase DltB (MBOAT superfamily)